MESIFIQQEFHPKFDEQNFAFSKNSKLIRKNTISYNKYKTPRLHNNLSNNIFRTGDRFIPFKNDKENFQNFLLHTPLPNTQVFPSSTNNNINHNNNSNNNNINGNNEQEILSPLDQKFNKI